MLSRDFVGGLVAIALGSLYVIFSFRQRVSALADTIGPAGIPKVLGILMLSLGIILCAQAIFQTRKSIVPTATEWGGEARKIFRAFGLVVIGVIYIFMLTFLGYVLSIALLLVAVAFYLGAAFNLRMILIAAAGAVLLWTIFVILLGVPMPAGIFSQG